MSKWRGVLCVQRSPKGDPRQWTLAAPLAFISDSGKVITAHDGFFTDFGSVPRAFWWYASPMSGRHAAAALIHDYCYATGCVPKKEADALFLEAMIDCGVRRTKAYAMAASVRAFGGRAWRKHRDRLAT